MRQIQYLFLFFLTSTLTTTGQHEKPDSSFTVRVESFLTAGPISAPSPVFHSEGISKSTPTSLLQYDYYPVDKMVPVTGQTLPSPETLSLVWERIDADSEGRITFDYPDDTLPRIYYTALYINANRWLKGTLTVHSCQLMQIYLNGDLVASKTTTESGSDTTACTPGQASKDIELIPGKHLIIIKTLRDPDSNSDWFIKGALTVKHPYISGDIDISTYPLRFIDMTNVLDDPRVDNARISPDGELAAVTITRALPPTDIAETWIEIYRTRDGQPYRTYRGGTRINGFAWSPDGTSYSYVQNEDGKTSLWVVNRTDGSQYALLEKISDFSSYQWSPDGSFIVYGITEREEPDKSGVRRVSGLTDRWPWWRHKTYLHLVHVPSGLRYRLTAGELSTSMNSISPDGSKIIFSRTLYDATERPYSQTEFYILDLTTMQIDSVYSGGWSSSAQWSPDGRHILFTGGPSFFGEKGLQIPSGRIPNEYDTQAYIYTIDTGKVEAITRTFDPSVSSAVWSHAENAIYLSTVDRSLQRLYRYDIRTKEIELVDLGIEILGSISFATGRPVAVYTGESASEPPKFYFIDLHRKRPILLADPNRETYRYIRTGETREWTFTNERGTEIDGMVYFPPDFDPTKKYPLIVNYYGGTTPTSRQFEGRYPKNQWAAHGYIVYVLQPSGAIGYGQEFSSLHVNEWGTIVADEIIDGTNKFLDAHPYVDRDRVAGIGASFGGFMTMLLLTRTDIFATAIAHAGISSIASYWGQGYWGYLYNAVAAANSFPWNRPDIFIDQSPLYFADRITTPLLLLHGKSDTNVPPGESLQLYTALKLLGREVEYIEVEAQDHYILNYSKRIVWGYTILAWFDKYLKDQPEWWNNMYK
jgi:dipeptidyl aminopeptidase/acylaminoacyl peptidase